MYNVSVVIPFYNTQKYLSDCINSVLAQELDNIEIILVNDGSEDNSLDIAKRYEEKYPQIKLINSIHAGQSNARNLGIEEASGKYIYFLDSDDEISKQFLKNCYNTAQQSDSDVVISYRVYSKIDTDKLSTLQTSANFTKLELIKNNKDIRFPVNVPAGEDGVFFNMVYAFANKITLCGENSYESYTYRKTGKNIHKYYLLNPNKVIGCIEKWLEVLKEFYLNNNLLPDKSINLARYIEHEPFNIRLKGTSKLNFRTRKKIYVIIKNYWEDFMSKYLSQEDFEKLSWDFKMLIKEKHFYMFEIKQIWLIKQTRYVLSRFYKKLKGKLNE